MNDTREMLLKTLSAKQFAFTELCLYLDTHPNDIEALRKSSELKSETDSLLRKFEEKYGPLTLGMDFGNDDFDWINNPWPWEKEAN